MPSPWKLEIFEINENLWRGELYYAGGLVWVHSALTRDELVQVADMDLRPEVDRLNIMNKVAFEPDEVVEL